MRKLPMEERDDLNPICPHCERQIERLYYRQIRDLGGKRNIYFCSDCHRVLGVAQERSLWTGT